MYNWDTTIFDNFTIPEELDKELLTDTIMLELGELELIYNDPSFMKFAIGSWSRKELPIWNKLYETTKLEYDPIENYNRVEETTDLETRDLAKTANETRDLSSTNNETRDLASTNNETRDLAGTSNETRDLAGTIAGTIDTTDTDTQSGSNTNTKNVNAYNSATGVTAETVTDDLGGINTKVVDTDSTQDSTDTGTIDISGTDTGTVNVATTDTGTDNVSGTDTGTIDRDMTDTGTVDNSSTDTGTVNMAKTSTIKGNIGVTTSQQMIEQERNVVKFNIYDYIVESFKQRFCILVY